MNAPVFAQNRHLPESHLDFLRLFYPKIREANNKIIKTRNEIIQLRVQYLMLSRLTPDNIVYLNALADYYHIDELDFNKANENNKVDIAFDLLLHHVDIVPEKLVLAQAIIESGWGTSYQSKHNNNYFGIQCWKAGCGEKPQNDTSAIFYYRTFPTSASSITYYLKTLNTHWAYVGFRKSRSEMRKCRLEPEPIILASSLLKYCEKGSVYIRLIENVLYDYLPENLDELIAGKEMAIH